MKQATTVKLKSWLQKKLLALIVLTVMIPAIGISQTPTSPGSGGGTSGGSADLGSVPFDWKLNLILLSAGILFAVVIVLRVQKNKLQKSTI